MLELNTPSPIAFLSHASEEKDLARRLAVSLIDAGIPTFYDEWEITAGDSIRQKIDQGLSECTHFIVLATPQSIGKPWVNAEIDAAFERNIQGTSKVIVVRYNLPYTALTPLLASLLSREISDEHYDEQVKQLVSDIWGVSDRPPLGPRPTLLDDTLVAQTGFSQAALLIARYFVNESADGYIEPQLDQAKLRSALSLTRDDAVDALDELEKCGLVHVHRAMTGSDNLHLMPQPKLFARFDDLWMDWDPRRDAFLIASRLQANGGSGMPTAKLAEEFGWAARRLNPALTILIEKRAVRTSNAKSHPFVKDWVQATNETRRLLKRWPR